MILLANSNAVHIPLVSNSINCVVTSPPYFGLRSYLETDNLLKDAEIGTEQSPEEYVETIVQVFREIWRVLRDDGTVWLNISDSYNGSGGAGGDYNAGGLKEGQPKYGGRNIDYIRPKSLILIPARVSLALQAEGWVIRNDNIWHKTNPMPESAKDRCTRSHEYIFLMTKNEKYWYDGFSIKEPYTEPMNRWGGQRLKANGESGWDKGTGQESYRDGDMRPDPNGRNKRSVWTVSTKPYLGAHYATFPPDLIEPCILAGCPETVCAKCGAPHERVVEKGEQERHMSESQTIGSGRGKNADRSKHAPPAPIINQYWNPTCDCNAGTRAGVVLDPFVGSGTTCMVARKHGRDAIGLDLSFNYLTVNARERLQYGDYINVADGISQLTIGV